MDDRGTWKSRFGFILAAAGSAVGLGNLWKFPYLTYKFGGGEDGSGAGAFVFIYLLSVLLLGLPVMIAEVLIGRRGRLNPVGSFRALRPKTPWKYAGVLGVATGFIILSYYAVVAGWTIEYIAKSITWKFHAYDAYVSTEQVKHRIFKEFKQSQAGVIYLKDHGLIKEHDDPAQIWPKLSPEQIKEAKDAAYESFVIKFKNNPKGLKQAILTKKMEIYPGLLFSDFLKSPLKQVGYFLLFMVFTVLVVIGGVSDGIERWNKVLMPLLFLILLILIGRVLTLSGGSKAFKFLFYPDFSRINSAVVLNAMGQAFFSLSLGMGALLTYGSYLPKDAKISTASVAIVTLDTLVALFAAFIIFGSIFTFGLKMQGGGIGNLFTAVPVIFLQMPGGRYLSILFYSLVAFAALTSTVSLLEVATSYLIDEKGLKRSQAVLLAGLGIFLLGIPSALSFNLLSRLRLFGLTFFDMADFFAANIALPLGGMLIAIFVGWVLTDAEKHEELFELSPILYRTWSFLVKFIAPIAIFIVLISLLVGKLHA